MVYPEMVQQDKVEVYLHYMCALHVGSLSKSLKLTFEHGMSLICVQCMSFDHVESRRVWLLVRLHCNTTADVVVFISSVSIVNAEEI